MSMRGISFCYPYYRNPGMLAQQYETWAAYPDELKQALEIVIVDDGSPEGEDAAAVERPEGLPRLRIYRVQEDKPWHQHAARNIAAHHAQRAWLLMIDMDHVVPADSLQRILAEMGDDKAQVFKFRRLDAPDLAPKLKDGKEHPHPNTFVIAKTTYWAVGGYDERLCGIYATDGIFRKLCVEHTGKEWIQTDIQIVRYDRAVIPDASTTTWDRERYRDGQRKKEIGKLIREGGTVTMQAAYDKVV